MAGIRVPWDQTYPAPGVQREHHFEVREVGQVHPLVGPVGDVLLPLELLVSPSLLDLQWVAGGGVG